MTEQEQNCANQQNGCQEEENGLSRRRFFKAGALGATLGAAALVGNKKALADETARAVITEEHNDFPIPVKKSYQRFAQRNSAFCRAVGQREPELFEAAKKLKGPNMALMGKAPRHLVDKEEGWTALEKALQVAGWAMEDTFASGSKFGMPNTQAYAWEGPTSSVQYQFKNKQQAAKVVKKAAKNLGASLVGITRYDERWVYDPLYNPRENKDIPAEFPFQPKSVVVLAFEMDYDRMETAPSWIEGSTVGQEYSRMATVGYSVATFLRSLGYKSFASGNDTALSIPFAVAAGLGETGRNGILVTYEYGPRVRLCKIFTELELEFDKPKTFGVREFCERCQRCADACPAKAIPKYEKPVFDGVHNKSNNPGVEKWYLDAEKCFKYWGESASDCGTCITSCPYNKPDFWHHKMVVWATKAAPGPLHSIMREMDIVFGYGNSFDKKALRQWWDT